MEHWNYLHVEAGYSMKHNVRSGKRRPLRLPESLPSDNGLLFFASMQMAAGPTIYDISGFQNHATISGATWDDSEHGSCVNFEQTDNDYAYFTNQMLDGLTAITMTAYVNFESIPTSKNCPFLQEMDDTNNQVTFRYRQANTSLQILVGNGTTFDNTNYSWNPTLNKWYHVAVTFDAGSVVMYIDGSQVTTDTLTVTQSGTGSATYKNIARQLAGAGDNFLDGKLKNIKAYNRALQASEIEELYKQCV